MKSIVSWVGLAGLAAGCFLATSAVAQSTAFTYQGRFNTNGLPYTGLAEFQFTLWDQPSAGNLTAATAPASVVVGVTNGLFATAVNFGTAAFPGAERWLQIEARTDIGPFTALTPRQALTPTPYALRALNVEPGGLSSGTYGSALVLNNPGNQFSGTFTGNGAGLTNLAAWTLAGNTGTAPGANFLGTTDNQSLEIRVNNQRAFRIEPSTGGPNLIGGSSNNSIGASSESSTVSGGAGNRIGTNSPGSTIAGGNDNRIGTNSFVSVVGGGYLNRIGDSTESGTIAGGQNGRIGTNAHYGTIGGGFGNRIQDRSQSATIAGGIANRIGTNAPDSFIGGGNSNDIGSESQYATISGGADIEIGTNSTASAIVGGASHRIVGDAPFSTIAGGRLNRIGLRATNGFAAGQNAAAEHPGTFVWADGASPLGVFSSTAPNQFSVRATGGVRFQSAGAGMTLDGLPVLAGTVNTGNLADNSVSADKMVDGAVTQAKIADNSVDSAKLADGSVQASDVNAASFNATFWRAGGNAGTTAGSHFLGTTDNQPLELKVNGLRAARLEPNSAGAPNAILGSPVNFVAPGAVGATIGGGGTTNVGGVARSNLIAGDFSVIGGGYENTIGTDARHSVIAGGSGNAIDSTAVGSAIGGGQRNLVESFSLSSAIAGGLANKILRAAAGASIAGGNSNSIGTNADLGFIGGGHLNRIANDSNNGAIAGGQSNSIGSNSTHGAIGGGLNNAIAANALYATIPGGVGNSATNFAFAAGRRARANHAGTFVWADDTDADFPSTTNKQFAVRANNGVMIQSATTALDLRGGGALRVENAGINSSTPIFTHQAGAANIFGAETRINHPLCNFRPNAILLVTYNFNPAGTAGVRNDRPVGIYYIPGAGRWAIYNLDGTAMPVGAAYNVLVANP